MPPGRSLRCSLQHDRPELLSTPHKQIVEVCKRLVRVGSPQLGEPLCVCTFSHLNLILSRILVHRVIAEPALLLPTVLSCRRTHLGHATFLLQRDSFPHRVPYSARGGIREVSGVRRLRVVGYDANQMLESLHSLLAPASSRREPGYRLRHALPRPDGLERPVRVYRPAVDAATVGVDRVEEPPVAGEGLVA